MDKFNSKVLPILTIIIAVFYTVLFFVLSIPRLLYPYEIEWMEGSVLDHAVRIVEGKQLYVHPTIHFVNWLYQPLYYYAAALAMHFFGIGYFAGRLVSMISTLGSATLIYFIIRKITKEKLFIPFIGVALFFASFAFTGYSYDIARIDPLLTVLLLSATLLCVYSSGIFSLACCALCFTLAYFTKQQAVFYIIPFFVWILLNFKKNSIIFIIVCLLLILSGTLLLRSWNGEWYQYFVYTVPKSKARNFGWLATFKVFPYFVFGSWTISSFSILIYLLVSCKNGIKRFFSGTEGLLALLYLTSIFQLGMHLGDNMSYKNVTLPFVCFSSILFPIAVSVIRTKIPGLLSEVILYALPIQFISLFYNPLKDPLAIITKDDYISSQNFITYLTDFPGTVFMPAHGLTSRLAAKETFANELATHDVYTVGDSTAITLQKDWNDALHNHKFAAIILDENPFRSYDSIDGYMYVRKINDALHPFRTRFGDIYSIPRFLYLPKDSHHSE